MTPVLEARGLARHYTIGGGLRPKKVVKAVDGISFALTPGRTLALVGESGCGKSTLARMIAMIEAPTAGTVTVDGAEIAALAGPAFRAARPKVQMVFQDPYGSLNPRAKVADILAEPLIINTGLSAAARGEAVRAMAAKVGLRPEHVDRYPHMFSGGQRQRIAIARALMLHPKVVVADEPVSALDLSIQAQVLNLLMDLQEDLDLAYLFISHDLSVIRHIAHDVIVMYLGRPVEQAPKALLFAQPRHPYTMALLASTPQVDPAHRLSRTRVGGELPSPLAPPPGCHFHRRCPFATERCSAEVPALRPVEGRLVACHYAETVAEAA